MQKFLSLQKPNPLKTKSKFCSFFHGLTIFFCALSLLSCFSRVHQGEGEIQLAPSKKLHIQGCNYGNPLSRETYILHAEAFSAQIFEQDFLIKIQNEHSYTTDTDLLYFQIHQFHDLIKKNSDFSIYSHSKPHQFSAGFSLFDTCEKFPALHVRTGTITFEQFDFDEDFTHAEMRATFQLTLDEIREHFEAGTLKGWFHLKLKLKNKETGLL